ncbi:MAG: PqqD family protein [Sterolibacteriaceae bacterium]|nr:PqqD family protein [Sterolibacteriaceae bacterium]MBK7665099.1 PqqD family protein [Sterolibacteriaceae bacterium]MBK9085357.1 PqqD family protein [Sterolibacteriaceae bacterium]
MELNTDSTLVASRNQVSADLSPNGTGEVVILGLKDGMYFEVNEVGARIWQMIQEPRTVRSVIAALLDEYDVTSEQCEADVLSIAGEMIRRGLAEIGNGQDP